MILPALAAVTILAAPDNNVEWAGISHVDFRDRRPLCPVNGETFEVRQIGGTIGDETLLAVGYPYFHTGEEVFLFLSHDGIAQRVLNAWQGAVRIPAQAELAAGGAEPLIPELGAQFPDAGARTLADLKLAVQAALEGGRP